MNAPLLAEISLGTGLDESQDDAYVPATALREAKNVVYGDRDTVKKRQGLTSFVSASGGSYSKLGKHGDELLVFDSTNLYAYSQDYGGLVTRGRVSPCLASKTLLASGSNQGGHDPTSPIVPLGSIAEDATTGLRVAAWNDGVALQASIRNADTGALINTYTINELAGGTGATKYQPHLMLVGSVAFLVYYNGDGSAVYYTAFDLNNLNAGWTTSSSLGMNPAFYDACAVAGGTQIVVFACDSGTRNATIYLYNTSGTTMTLSSSWTVETMPTPSRAYEAAAVYADTTEGIVVAYVYDDFSSGTSNTYLLRWAAYTTGGVATQAATTAVTDTSASGDTNVPAIYYALGVTRLTGSGSGNTSQYVLTWTRAYQMSLDSLIAGGTPSNPSRSVGAMYWSVFQKKLGGSIALQTFGPMIPYQTMSKPIVVSVAGGHRAFVLAKFYDAFRFAGSAAATNASPTLVLLELDTNTNHAAYSMPYASAVVAARFAGDSVPCSMESAAATTTTGIVAVGAEVDSAGTTSLSSVLFDFDDHNLFQTASLGDWTWIAAGLPMIYDGQTLSEVGFIAPPAAPVAQAHVGAAVGFFTDCQTLQYCAVYVWPDSNGNVHRSAPSAFSEAINCASGGAGTGADDLKVTVATCRLTYRQAANQSGNIGANPVRIEIYRNTATTPDIWQLCATLANDPTVPSLTFEDTMGDGTLASKRFLYTTGGAVESDGPPSLSALCVHADRIFGISEDGRTAYFTTAYVRGECPRFTDTFTVNWPTGPITAQWSTEGRLHAATSRQTFFLFGDGPGDTGAGVDFTQPQLWQPDLGVQDMRGVASWQGGNLLATSKGLYFESRAGEFSWVGEKVRRTLATYPTVTSITPLTNDGVVRITCSDGSNGATLHWDYRRDRWATHYTTQASLENAPALSSVEAGGVWYALYTNGTAFRVVQEDPSTNLDDGTWVTMTVTPGWFHPEGMLGYMRMRRVQVFAQSQSAHGLTVRIARNYAASYSDTATFAEADLTGLDPEQVQFSASAEKCEAFSISVSDVAPQTLGTGAGAVLKTAVARLQVRSGDFKQLKSTVRK